jgi:hypothetical protein
MLGAMTGSEAIVNLLMRNRVIFPVLSLLLLFRTWWTVIFFPPKRCANLLQTKVLPMPGTLFLVAVRG